MDQTFAIVAALIVGYALWHVFYEYRDRFDR